MAAVFHGAKNGGYHVGRVKVVSSSIAQQKKHTRIGGRKLCCSVFPCSDRINRDLRRRDRGGGLSYVMKQG